MVPSLILNFYTKNSSIITLFIENKSHFKNKVNLNKKIIKKIIKTIELRLYIKYNVYIIYTL